MYRQLHGLPLILMALTLLVWGAGPVLAQGRGPRFGADCGMGHRRHTGQGMAPQMQQMGGLMLQMAERIKAGPLTPDQALRLSGAMEQLATIMNKMAAGIPDTDIPTQLEALKTRLTDLQLQPPPQQGRQQTLQQFRPCRNPRPPVYEPPRCRPPGRGRTTYVRARSYDLYA